uniref:Conserved hypothetical plastid protein n=1 Tax=Olisthodiscus luteus TaxID=83000 RepID=A0A7U0KRW0_OLILU|nr:conserved hypothetical plastid protein [Olisthodiscus luteus]QQW50540.1 conserved hypothetical plastid protein [Olisthodiscus luteus]
MCVCINCFYLTFCSRYYLFEKIGLEANTAKYPFFYPFLVNVVFHIKMKNQSISSITLEWDIIECLSFVDKPGLWHSISKN